MIQKTAIPLSLTGRFAPLGKKAAKGITLWTKYARANSKTETAVEDDESSAEKAAAITEKLCSDKTVGAVFGPYSSSLALAAAKSASRAGRTLWNHGGASDEINGYANTVSAITPASGYFIPVVEKLARDGAESAVIAVAKNSGFSKAVADGAERCAAESGIKIRRVEYVSGTADFGNVLDELKKNRSALLSAGRMEDDMALAKEVLSMREKPAFLCFVAAGMDEFFQSFGDRSEGVFAVSQWEEDNPRLPAPDFGPTSAEFSRLFGKEYGHPPDYIAAQAFNIGLIVWKCCAEAGTADDKVLRKTAGESDFTTFYGRFKIDKTGKQTGHRTVLTQWKGGKRLVSNAES